jgi:hypothetical protein
LRNLSRNYLRLRGAAATCSDAKCTDLGDYPAQNRAAALVACVRKNPRFDPNGILIMGRLYKAKKKGGLVAQQ